MHIAITGIVFLVFFQGSEEIINFQHPQSLSFDQDVFRNITELISSKLYPVEEHEVISEDGYILGLQRIPRGKDARALTKGPPVLLHHGLFTNGVDFVFNFPEQSLGFILADAGYDVWITNVRGTRYSKKHVSLTPKSPEYWKFSWDEMALVDLPATIDYILNVTAQDQLFYVGHSMGTTIIFALLSDKPEYNDKVRVAVSLAPSVLMGHTHDRARIIVKFLNQTEFLLDLLGHGELLPNGFVQALLRVLFCEADLQGCYSWAKSITGMSAKQLNLTRVPVYLANGVDGSSVHTFIHYGQEIKANRFQKFDYGPKENLVRYKQITPPEYSLEKISAPMALMWGLNDQIASPVDVSLLAMRLKSVVLNYQVPDPEWTHDDFVLAINANKFVYQEVLNIFKRFYNS